MNKLIIFSVLVVVSSCASTNHYQSSTPPELIIDGINNDWPELTEFNKNSTLQYGVFNDSDFLYILMQTDNIETQRKILGMGLTLWIDQKGKKKENTGINFPLSRIESGNNTEMRRQMDNPNRDYQTTDPSLKIKTQIQRKGEQAKIIGFYGEEPVLADVQQLNTDMEWAIGYNSDQRSLTYEVKVPLSLAKKNNDPGIIGIGFETGSMDSNQANMPPGGMRRAGGMGGGQPGMSPGGRSGGMGGRQGMPSGQQMQSMRKPLTMWIKVQLIQ